MVAAFKFVSVQGVFLSLTPGMGSTEPYSAFCHPGRIKPQRASRHPAERSRLRLLGSLSKTFGSAQLTVRAPSNRARVAKNILHHRTHARYFFDWHDHFVPLDWSNVEVTACNR